MQKHIGGKKIDIRRSTGNGKLLTDERRAQLEQRRADLKLELRLIACELHADASARLQIRLKTPPRPILERRNGKHWEPVPLRPSIFD